MTSIASRKKKERSFTKQQTKKITMLSRKETRDLIKNKYGAFILEFRDRENVSAQSKSWIRIAISIIDQEPKLKERSPERLRKTVAKVYQELSEATNNDVRNESVTQEGYGEQSDNGYKDVDIKGDAFLEFCKEKGLDPNIVDNAKFITHLNKEDTFNVNLNFKKGKDAEKTYMDYRDEIIKDMDKHSPEYEGLKILPKKSDGRLLFIGIADLHLNQLSSMMETGGVYNTDIAIERTKNAVAGLLEEAKGYNITDVVITTGNDVLNTDNTKATTTAGTHQDTDSSIFDTFVNARKMFVSIMDLIISQGYNLQVVHIPANHDLVSGFMLTDSLASWYRNTDVVFHADMQFRKYVKFGANLLGFSHGDTSAKKEKLALLMAEEAKVDWGITDFRYFYLGHVHHKITEDYVGVTLESLRTVTKPSAWAKNQGYISQEGMSAFVHDKKDGQIAKLMYNF